MGIVLMSEHELQRVEVLSRVLDGRMRSSTAASVLAISERQVQRLLRRYRESGAGAIRHGLLGRPSNTGTVLPHSGAVLLFSPPFSFLMALQRSLVAGSTH